MKNRLGKIILGTLLVIAILGSRGNVSAQGFNFRGTIGYAMPMAGQTLDGTGMPYNGNTTNSVVDSANYTSYSIKGASFSSGFHGTLGVGYMFSKYIGVDLAMSFGVSSTSYTYNDNNEVLGGVAYNVQVVQKAQSPLMLIPALVLQNNGAVFNVYARFGLALPLNTTIIQDQYLTNLPGTGAIETDDYTWQVKNSFSLGMVAALGLQYKVTDHFKISFEASMLSLSVYTKEADLTNISVDGQGNYVSQVPAAQTKIYYSDNFKTVSNDYYHQPVYSQPFSNLSFNIGFQVLFPSEKQYGNKYKYTHKKYSEEDHINRF